MKIKLRANKNASNRTRNHIHEHGPEFELLNEGYPKCLGLAPAMLLRTNTFFGWMPKDEVDEIKENDEN